MKHFTALPLAALPLAALLWSCASSDFAPLEGMPAAIGETVRVGTLLATPRSVVEDSRCPYNVRCIQAGRLVVSTRLVGDGWSETVPLTLGEPYQVQGTTVMLVSGRPEKYAARRTPRNEYRFIFEGS
jgi:hypothetical protein